MLVYCVLDFSSILLKLCMNYSVITNKPSYNIMNCFSFKSGGCTLVVIRRTISITVSVIVAIIAVAIVVIAVVVAIAVVVTIAVVVVAISVVLPSVAT